MSKIASQVDSSQMSGSPQLQIEILSARGLAQFQSLQSETLQSIQLHVLFKKCMIKSSPVVSNNSNEVIFDYLSSFPVSDKRDVDSADISSPATDDQSTISPILIYLTTSSVTGQQQQPVGQNFTRSIIAMAVIDYRMAFMYGGEFISVELIPQDSDGISYSSGTGSIFVRLSFTGPVVSPFATTNIKAIENSIEMDLLKYTEVSRHTHQSAKTFWGRARQDFPFLDKRDIKLFAEDETGQHRVVCAFVEAITPPREIDNPKSAARFVSLIPFRREVALTGGRRNIWQSPHAFMSCLQGDVEDHAILLCCLLLGWGMDAWVAMGTISAPPSSKENVDGSNSNSSTRPHMWVVTFDTLSEGKIICWEALTGQQYDLEIDLKRRGKFVNLVNALDKSKSHPFLQVHALFRSDTFLLNVQKSPTLNVVDGSVLVGGASFSIKDSSNWLSFSIRENQKMLRHPGSVIHMMSTSIDSSVARKLEVDLETNIKNILTQWRAERGLQTHFDNQLGLVLQSALSAYELDRTLGVTVGHVDFQCAVKRYVFPGECFKAYPTCFSHANPNTIYAALRQAAAAREVMMAQSSVTSRSAATERVATRHAVRAKIFAYPEGTMSVWVIVAACFTGNQ